MDYEVGSLVEGTVVDIVKFGAFVKIKGGKTGLVHISQISDKFVREVSEHIAVGTKVYAKVISIDDRGRVQLSIKDVSEEDAEAFLSEQEQNKAALRQSPPAHSETSGRHREDDSFESKFKRFIRQSEDRQVDIKRNIESKRGNRKRRK